MIEQRKGARLEPSLSSSAGPRPVLSVVAPCYNEEGGLKTFVERTSAACRAAGAATFEIVLVNDGSRDTTWQVISDLSTAHPEVVGVNLSRNYGHQLAASAGLALARGERVVLIDADLQDPPELFTDMMRLIDEGFDVVYAKRRRRANESAFKLATASAFYRVLASLSEVKIPTDTGDYRMMTRRVIDRLNAMPEQDRFIRGMVAWLGGKQTELLYDRDARFAGETSYTLAKMLQLAIAGITSFSTAPLRLATYLAVGTGFVGVLLILYTLVTALMGRTVPGWASLGIMISFFSVGQFFCLAIIGAYLGRVFMQVKGRPLYHVDEIVCSSAESPAIPATERAVRHVSALAKS